MISRRVELGLIASVVIAFALLLGRALHYDFVWDDVAEIQNNPAFDRPLVDGLSLTQTERTDPDLTELTTIELAYDSYRPVTFASLWIDIQLFGRSPFALHLTSLVLGALAIAAAYVLARKLLGPAQALVATALFALHPVQIETIAYVSARADLLAGLFILFAALAGLRTLDATGTRRALWIATTALAFALSLLAKESYVGFPLVLAALAWAQDRPRRALAACIAMFAVLVSYFALRSAMVSSTTSGAIGDALLALPAVWGRYLQIVALPFDLSTERVFAQRSAILGVALLALVGILWVRRRSAKSALAGLAWFALLVGPAAVAIASQHVVADRYVYAPLFGVALAIAAGGAWLVERVPRAKLAVFGAGALWAALLLLVAWRQVPVWQSNATLYANAVEMAPDSSKAQYRMGFLDAQAGRWSDALARFEAAIALDPENILALNNAGVANLRLGRPAAAIAPLEHAVQLNPAHFRAWLNLGLARLATGDRRGCADIDRALAVNPSYAAALRARCPATSASGPSSP